MTPEQLEAACYSIGTLGTAKPKVLRALGANPRGLTAAERNRLLAAECERWMKGRVRKAFRKIKASIFAGAGELDKRKRSVK
jgi:hypothetical protein